MQRESSLLLGLAAFAKKQMLPQRKDPMMIVVVVTGGKTLSKTVWRFTTSKSQVEEEVFNFYAR